MVASGVSFAIERFLVASRTESQATALHHQTMNSTPRIPVMKETTEIITQTGKPTYSFSQSLGDPSEWRVWRHEKGKPGKELVAVCGSRNEAWELVQELSEDQSIATYRAASRGE